MTSRCLKHTSILFYDKCSFQPQVTAKRSTLSFTRWSKTAAPNKSLIPRVRWVFEAAIARDSDDERFRCNWCLMCYRNGKCHGSCVPWPPPVDSPQTFDRVRPRTATWKYHYLHMASSHGWFSAFLLGPRLPNVVWNFLSQQCRWLPHLWVAVASSWR